MRAAAQIEAKLNQGYGPDAIANLVCRLMMSKDERIAALMTCKWTEWRYGKAKEHGEHTGAQALAIQIISHVPRPGEPVPERETELRKPVKPN